MNAVLPLEQTDPELAEHFRLIANGDHPVVRSVEINWKERRYHLWDANRLLTSRVLVVKTQVPGRNEPCLCGSGKKFKKCCGLIFKT